MTCGRRNGIIRQKLIKSSRYAPHEGSAPVVPSGFIGFLAFDKRHGFFCLHRFADSLQSIHLNTQFFDNGLKSMAGPLLREAVSQAL
jgi:hypothetical protein